MTLLSEYDFQPNPHSSLLFLHLFMFSTFYIVGVKVKSEPGSEDCESDESPEKGKNLRSAIKKLIFAALTWCGT